METLTRRDLLAQIATLELEGHQVSARRRRMHERIAIFPSEALQREERTLSGYRRDLFRRTHTARATLARLRIAEREAYDSRAQALTPVS
jgi:hypothetical protein